MGFLGEILRKFGNCVVKTFGRFEKGKPRNVKRVAPSVRDRKERTYCLSIMSFMSFTAVAILVLVWISSVILSLAYIMVV